MQLVALDHEGNPVWSGSGTFVSAEGLILTNAHVVEAPDGEYETLAVGVSRGGAARAPDLRYEAEVAALDTTLDLAVVRIVRDMNGKPVTKSNFPTLELGSSRRVQPEDLVRIVGYPGHRRSLDHLHQGNRERVHR